MTASPPRRPAAPALFVWAVWLAMTVASFWMVNKFGGRVPYFDDFFYFGTLTSDAVPTPARLWEPLNEHRLPLPKLVSWLTARATGYKLKAQLRLDLAILAAATAVATLTPRLIRGSTAYSDAFIPLVNLTLGQPENTLWAVQVNFLLPASLMLACVHLVASAGPALTPRTAAGIGGLLFATSLCGLQGQLFALPVTVWLLVTLLAARQSSWRGRLPGVLAGLATLAVIAATVATHETSARHTEPKLDAMAARYFVRVIGGGWGPTSETVGPLEPTPMPSVVGVITLLVTAIVGWWVLRGVRGPERRVASSGLLAVLAGLLLLCAAIAYGRAHINGGLLANRYVILATPLLTWVYVAAVRFAPDAPGRVICSAMFLAVAVAAVPNAERGVEFARLWKRNQDRIEHDAKRGVPVSFLTAHHGEYLFPSDPPVAGPVFETLRLKRIPPFDQTPEEPTVREVPATWRLVSAVPPADADGVVRVAPLEQGRIVVELDLPPSARGIVLRGSVAGTPNMTRAEVRWTETPPDELPVWWIVRDLWKVDGPESAKRVWLGKPVRRIELRVDGPAVVRLGSITALLAE